MLGGILCIDDNPRIYNDDDDYDYDDNDDNGDNGDDSGDSAGNLFQVFG